MSVDWDQQNVGSKQVPKGCRILPASGANSVGSTSAAHEGVQGPCGCRILSAAGMTKRGRHAGSPESCRMLPASAVDIGIVHVRTHGLRHLMENPRKQVWEWGWDHGVHE